MRSPRAALTWNWVRNRLVDRSAARRSVARRSAPIRSARRRSAPRRSAPIRYAPRRSAPWRSAPRSVRPTRSAPRRSDRRRSAPRRSCPALVGPALVCPASVGPALVRPALVGRARSGTPRGRSFGDLGPDQLAGLAQQRVHPVPQPGHFDRAQLVRPGVAQPPQLLPGQAQLGPQRVGGGQRECLGQVPEQLVHLPHHRERGEHRFGQLRRAPPVAAAERVLRDGLTGPEAVEDGAAGEAAPAQVVVDAATEVVAQVGAGPAGRLVDGEVGGRGEGRRNTAQPDTAAAVGPQLVPVVADPDLGLPALHPHRRYPPRTGPVRRGRPCAAGHNA